MTYGSDLWVNSFSMFLSLGICVHFESCFSRVLEYYNNCRNLLKIYTYDAIICAMWSMLVNLIFLSDWTKISCIHAMIIGVFSFISVSSFLLVIFCKIIFVICTFHYPHQHLDFLLLRILFYYTCIF